MELVFRIINLYQYLAYSCNFLHFWSQQLKGIDFLYRFRECNIIEYLIAVEIVAVFDSFETAKNLFNLLDYKVCLLNIHKFINMYLLLGNVFKNLTLKLILNKGIELDKAFICRLEMSINFD